MLDMFTRLIGNCKDISELKKQYLEKLMSSTVEVNQATIMKVTKS